MCLVLPLGGCWWVEAAVESHTHHVCLLWQAKRTTPAPATKAPLLTPTHVPCRPASRTQHLEAVKALMPKVEQRVRAARTVEEADALGQGLSQLLTALNRWAGARCTAADGQATGGDGSSAALGPRPRHP